MFDAVSFLFFLYLDVIAGRGCSLCTRLYLNLCVRMKKFIKNQFHHNVTHSLKIKMEIKCFMMISGSFFHICVLSQNVWFHVYLLSWYIVFPFADLHS